MVRIHVKRFYIIPTIIPPINSSVMSSIVNSYGSFVERAVGVLLATFRGGSLDKETKSTLETVMVALILIYFLVHILDQIVDNVSNDMIFLPIRIDKNEYEMFQKDTNVIREKIYDTDSRVQLDACLYNSYRKPSYTDDIIYLYSHGNSGWLGSVIGSLNVKQLSKYGSVFLYDYRGYGRSTGEPTEKGVFADAINVWTFLVDVKKVKPQHIILFGHSLGTSVTAHLMLHLLKCKAVCSECMILQNPFYSMQRMAGDIVPVVGKLVSGFVKSTFKTNEFIKSIDRLSSSAKIFIIHCKNDKLIHYQHSVDLHDIVRHCYCSLLLVDGTHDGPTHSEKLDEHFMVIDRKIRKAIDIDIE